jgi:E3 ubiquitin-protein ligase HERC2
MIFGQIFQHHKKDDSFKGAFKRNGTDSQMFSVSLAGEGSIDVGGPFREALTNVVMELETDALPLLIKTPNNRNDHGSSRDCFILNPASTTPTHSELFVFLGYFLGFSIRSQSAMDWHFPPIFWKQLLGEEVTLNDLEGLDAYSW